MEEPRNIFERALWEVLKEGGWELLKNGWPDILAVKEDRVIVCEVKAKRGIRLKEDQLRCMSLLSRAGVECYRWDKDDGFQPYNETLPDVKALNRARKTREQRAAAHTCPICKRKEKGLRDLVCYRCEHNPQVAHIVQSLLDKRQMEVEAQAKAKGLGTLER